MAETRLDFHLAFLNLRPQLVGHDTQLRYLADHPLAFIIHPRFTILRLGVLSEIAPVEYEATNIGLVVENPGTTISMTADGRVTPFKPARAWYGGQTSIEFDSQFFR
ncbi:hypothetical protein G6L28_22675 [Agrobacterium larrymoorei]|nr:hypothetical protein [Agrobacterium larrymoorei]